MHRQFRIILQHYPRLTQDLSSSERCKPLKGRLEGSINKTPGLKVDQNEKEGNLICGFHLLAPAEESRRTFRCYIHGDIWDGEKEDDRGERG